MIDVRPLALYFPKNPSQQVLGNFNSLPPEIRKTLGAKPANFIRVIEAESPRTQWEYFCQSNAYRLHTPQFYVLQIQAPHGSYTGILGGIAASDLQAPKIHLHENILAPKVERMQAYLQKLRLQAEAVVLGFDFSNRLTTALQQNQQQRPLEEFGLDDQHYRLWQATPALTQALEQNPWPEGFLVDGHHRAACLSALQQQNPQQPYRLLSFCLDNSQVRASAFVWRVSKPSKSFIDACSRWPQVAQAWTPTPAQTTVFWKQQAFLPPGADTLSQLQNIHRLCHKHQAKIRYTPLEAWEPLSSQSSEELVICYPPLSFQQIQQLAQKGEKLPPKSTYLFPKLPTGLGITEI